MLLSRLVGVSALLICAAVACDALPAESQAVTVFAAGSLKDALQEAAASYKGASGAAAKFSFGLSADLARQIENKALAQIFVSATKQLVDNLARKGRIEEGSVVSPIGNGLVLIAPITSQLDESGSSISDLSRLLGPNGRLATGDPAFVALGIYAMEALTKLGQWRALEGRLARAQNVQAALELVENGAAPLGIVFSTTAASSSKVKVLAHFPRGSYTPVRYTFAIVKGENGPKVRQLFNYLIGPEALSIYAKYGFITSGD
jgi:molybdate transport system substrate-binding protein